MRVLVVAFWTALILCHLNGVATHIRGGEIIVKHIPNAPLTFEISVIGYVDTDSQIEMGGGVLRFGDGKDLSGPFQTTLESISAEVAKIKFTTTHSYQGPSAAGYLITYQEDFRNGNVINIEGGGAQTSFFVETLLVIDPFLGPNSTPYFTAIPDVSAEVGKVYSHDPGGYDPDGDLLTYRIVEVKRAQNTIVGGYREPNHPDFYSNFSQGNEAKDGPPLFSIDKFTGDITWDAPGDITNQEGGICEKYAEYNVAIAVDEWRNVQGVWRKMGYVTRDFQIIVCDQLASDGLTETIADTCIVAGTPLKKTFLSTDFGAGVFSIDASGIPFEIGAMKEPLIDPNRDTLNFSWSPTCSMVSAKPYQVYFSVSARNSDGFTLTKIYNWNIRVVGSEVTGIDLEDQIDGSIKVSWDAYACGEVDSLQIWRKEGPSGYALCELQDSGDLGFALAGQVSPDIDTFVDEDVPEGKIANDFSYHIIPLYKDTQTEAFRALLTSVEGFQKSEVLFYPNPSRGSIYVEAKDQITHYRLIDLSGKAIFSGELDTYGEIKGLNIDVDSGVYIIQFLDRHERLVGSGRLLLSHE